MNRPSLASAISEESAAAPAAGDATVYVRALSAASGAGLRALARTMAARTMAGRPVRAAAAPARTGPHRLVAVGSSPAAVAARLAAFGSGQPVEGLYLGQRPDAGAPPVVFMFTGLGSEYPGMGRRLFAHSRVFRRELAVFDTIYRRLCGEPLLAAIDPPFGDGARLGRTVFMQPALFAFEYALSQVWRAAGIEPAAVMGYSLGEDVAACVAGAAPPDELFEFVVARACLMEQFHGDGEMAAVFADEARVRSVIAAHPEVAVAAVNGRENTVIAGPAQAIDRLLAGLALQRIRTRRVHSGHAFHSPLMDPLLGDIERRASVLTLRAPRLPLVSSATGWWAGASETTAATFWSRRIRETVRFSDGLEMLYARGYRVFVEMGPHPVLLSMARRCLPEAEMIRVPALRRDEDDLAVTAAGLSTVFVHGIDVRWRTLDGTSADGSAPVAAARVAPGAEASL